LTIVSQHHQSTQPEADYLFSIRLVGSKRPTIMRILLIPSTFTFEQFNDVIQIAFGWTNYHGHYFTVSMLPKEDEVRPFFHLLFSLSILAAMNYEVGLMTSTRGGL
jgi:pRiA4b ORF-3-like protein